MKETYTRNLNPFDWKGKVGRWAFFITNTFYYILMVLSIVLLCPITLKNYSEPMLIQSKSPIEIMTAYSPNREIAFYLLIIIAHTILSFILYKKRLLDISGNKENSLKNSFLLAGAICCLTLQLNLFVQTDSIISTILYISFMVIYLFLLFKKGTKEETTDKQE